MCNDVFSTYFLERTDLKRTDLQRIFLTDLYNGHYCGSAPSSSKCWHNWSRPCRAAAMRSDSPAAWKEGKGRKEDQGRKEGR